MTSRDWTAVARVLACLRRRLPADQLVVLDEVARELARMFAKDSTRFDEEKFLQLAGVRAG